MLSDDERALLEQWTRDGSAGYQIQGSADAWTWSFRSLSSARTFPTQSDAARALEAYIALLVECDRVERERRYAADPPAEVVPRHVAEPGHG